MVAAQVIHGAIVGTGFVPYFILEAFGISLPFIGLPSLDSTYAWSPMVQLLLLMLATFSIMTAYMEFKMIMPSEVFCYYHYPLSAAILLWQLQPTTSLIGIIFFAMPHMFTMWASMATFAKDKVPAALL